MPARRAAAKPTEPDTVTVTVVAPHAVYHDGEQRGGTLTGVDRKQAQHWERHGWVSINQANTE